MANVTPRRKRAVRGELAVLSLRDAAQILRQPVDDLLGRPGFLALVIDLSGRRRAVRKLEEEDYDELLVRVGDLDAWLETRRYAGGVAA